MKKVLSLVFVLLLTLAMFTGAVAEDKVYEIGFAHYIQCEFIQLLEQGIRDKLDEVLGEGKYNLTVFDANYEIDTQFRQLENLINSGVDGIILAPVDNEALIPAIATCADANMPMVVTNCRLATDEDYFFSGPDDVLAGRVVAQAVVDALGGEGKVGVMECQLGTSWQIDRKEGILQVIEENPGIELLDIQCAGGSRVDSIDLAENWITSFGDEITGVICENDEMALGASSAFISANRPDVAIAGVDAIEDALNAVKRGELVATVYQDAALEGGFAAEMLVKLINGETPDPMKHKIDMILVTADTADEYLK